MNVIVLKISIGIKMFVFNVWMEKYGIIKLDHVFAKLELNGMGIFVLWFNNVMEEWSGIKILGLVNVNL